MNTMQRKCGPFYWNGWAPAKPWRSCPVWNTSLISDPGYKLVRECVAAGLPVTTLPGACAPVTALVLSGLPSDRFLFAGFLPPKSAARRSAAHELATLRAALILFSSRRSGWRPC